MNVVVINRTIREMCKEVKAQEGPLQDWRLLTEEDLLYEAAVCIFGSQMVFEMAVATADRLRDAGLIKPQHQLDRSEYQSRIVAALVEPLSMLSKDSSTRLVRPRFKNRLATLLAITVSEVYGNARSVGGLLVAATGAKDARASLMRNIWGFGPKQASLFLRRIGFCADLAVLDVHVLDYLLLVRGITALPSKLGRLSCYEEIEDTFREVAAQFGHSLGCVDLATWLTMRVAKREYYL